MSRQTSRKLSLLPKLRATAGEEAFRSASVKNRRRPSKLNPWRWMTMTTTKGMAKISSRRQRTLWPYLGCSCVAREWPSPRNLSSSCQTTLGWRSASTSSTTRWTWTSSVRSEILKKRARLSKAKKVAGVKRKGAQAGGWRWGAKSKRRKHQ